MYKIVDLYKTRYFYVTYDTDLIYLFNTILKLQANPAESYHAGSELHDKLFKDVIAGKEVIIDLAGAKFTSDTTVTLMQYMHKGIKFADSEDKVRNSVLEENMHRLAMEADNRVLLPRFTNRSNIQEYLSSLERDVLYTVPATHNDLYVPLVILIQLIRPTIKIDMGYKDNLILGKVADYFTPFELQQYKEFYFVSDEGVMELKPDADGTYSIQQELGLRIEDVQSYGNLVPMVFGHKRLASDEPWRSLCDECLRVVDSYKLTYQPTIEEVMSNET